MSISLNNHESRIAALESDIEISTSYAEFVYTPPSEHPDPDTGIVTVLFKTTGLKILFGQVYLRKSGQYVMKLPVYIKNTGVTGLAYSHNATNAHSSPLTMFRYANTSEGIAVDRETGISMSSNSDYANVIWIAIGILYTYRYIIKSAQKFAPLSYLFNKEV